MDKITDDIILARLAREHLTEEEQKAFEEWYAAEDHRKQYDELLRLRSAIHAGRAIPDSGTGQAWKKFYRHISADTLRRNILKYSAAAILLLAVGTGIYLLQRPEGNTPVTALQQEVEPGKKQAVLTLSNGQRIFLNNSVGHIRTHEKGIEISNSQNMLTYASASADTLVSAPNRIEVPRGGEYQLTLTDGTIVWLNSESHLTYPTHFSGNQREVTLRGEAYFDVARHPEKPFIVHTASFDIRVVGTEFNVRTYTGEPESTTLAKGSIRLERDNRICRLKPGEQAVMDQGQITIRQVDPEEAIAWRHEAFSFKEQRLENIMNELARWYDVDIFYQNTSIKGLHFTAWFSRSSTIREVIGVLEKTRKIKLNLQGRTLIVAGIQAPAG